LTTPSLDLPDLIEWHEGMLLTPQHFQQLTARAELLTHFMSYQVSSFGWGVIQIKIDESALAGGIFRVLNLEAVLPDGLLALGGQERGIELQYDLSKIEGDRSRIYLTVPRDPALYPVTDYSRFETALAAGELTSDPVSGADPIAIPRIRPRLGLECGEANLGGFTALPLIEFGRQGTVFKPTAYIAPFLRLKPGSPLANLCAAVRLLVRQKATELASKLSPNAKNDDLAGMHQLQWLVSALPAVEVLLDGDQTHPYTLYLALCSMAGSVAFLSHARVPPIFQPYNHSDMRACFQDVVGYIRRALSEGLVENWLGKEFRPVLPIGDKAGGTGRQRGSAYFEIGPTLEQAFGEGADFSAPYIGLMLRAPAGVPPSALAEWGTSCLLAAEDAIADLELSRSKGAVCERVDAFEDLIPSPGSVLFRVKNDVQWVDPYKKLVLKSAKQETRTPDAAALFIKARPGKGRGGP